MTRRERPYIMATRSTEASDSALHDICAAAISIAALLIVFAFASLVGR